MFVSHSIKKMIPVLILFLLFNFLNVSGSSIVYFPDVKSQMSHPSYWSEDNTILMDYNDIIKLNETTISQQGTYMYDLKNQPEAIDGIALNDALITSSKADASYYLGWTYIESDTLATEKDYEEIINNTQNPNAKREQKVLYGVAVKRTELRTFPSPKAIWDDPGDSELDYQFLSAVRVNEPLVITSKSADGKYYLAKNICCSGWVPCDAVAICTDREEWINAWDIPTEEALVVYGDRVYTETSITGDKTSDLMLTMGTVLRKGEITDANTLIDNRSVYQNYVVWIPLRNPDGSYQKKLTLISEHNKVNDGFITLTKKNILKVAFSALGNTYGWGGGLNSDDCSGYIRNIYKCFGIELARNTTWQSAMPMAKTDMNNMCREERMAVLDALPPGAVLYFNGHEMLYLGSENGKYYVVSSLGSVMQPGNNSVRQRIRSIIINTLDVKRANGNSWIDELTLALIPYETPENTVIPKHKWYHDAVGYCIKNNIMKGDENNFFNPTKNITWAEVLTVIWNMENKPVFDGMSEADNDKWYASAVRWAKGNILPDSGIGDFNPESAITRQEIATVFYRYAIYKKTDALPKKEIDISIYKDSAEIHEYALLPIKYLLERDVLNGVSDNEIRPSSPTTRAEMAVIIHRFSNLSVNK